VDQHEVAGRAETLGVGPIDLDVVLQHRLGEHLLLALQCVVK